MLPYVEELGYNDIGYGCKTCIGNTGPLSEPIERSIDAEDLWMTGVLWDNRNFEARIHPNVRASYLASPPLVVAYGLFGYMDIDLERETHSERMATVIRSISRISGPTPTRSKRRFTTASTRRCSGRSTRRCSKGASAGKTLDVPTGDDYERHDSSMYSREPPIFKDFPLEQPGVAVIEEVRTLLLLGDTVRIDHIDFSELFIGEKPARQ